ncbi:polysaccharide deacetylase family protein [Streptomyces sp. 3MP-14]|uniref:Polysaccharide deacetylase family protein n=1 Tax=Streptomyces mimosae TaxID=2586635 RepID=A0A5N6A2Q9_9ACTN|nr:MULTISPECIES: polysaccharide deacetylase family protein [Streptomyces]KAB8162196.1 polysaccharide deacetylase family protein [Streptomyces mimosae]KAB8173906.1 polysaccharide deacetylase family protein [Streptomyces sp. 3MP-14]
MATVSPADARSGPAVESAVSLEGPDCGELKCIALTFDSAPSEHTPELLEILREEEVSVTFFLLGRNHVDTYPELVRQMVDEGHEVANHTWTHPRLTDLDRDEVREELSRTQEAIAELTGVTPTLMRPPQGRTNDMVGEVSEELGLAQVLWSVTAKDYETTDSELIEERVLDGADRDGIILLHDLYDGTVPAVPGIIERLKAEHYTFVTVTQLMAPGAAEPGRVYR